VQIAIISDTHMPRGNRRLPDVCVEHLSASDLIVHAGDLVTMGVLDGLRFLGPDVIAVHGNVDDAEVRRALPGRAEFELAGARIGVIHDAGTSRGRLARMRSAFPDADAVIFGHSHIPLHERDEDGFQIFNPGSPTERRRAAAHTMGIARVGVGSPERDQGSAGARGGGERNKVAAIDFELVPLD
jgi:putative phosphoesterase